MILFLPVFLIFGSMIFLLEEISKFRFWLNILQQMLQYSIILNIIDIGNRIIAKKKDDRSFSFPLIILIFSLLFFIYFYKIDMNNNIIFNIIIILSLFCIVMSFILYYYNPNIKDYSPKDFTENKKHDEEKATNKFTGAESKSEYKT